MLIAGARGLGKQLLDILQGSEAEANLIFYDRDPSLTHLYSYPVLNDLERVAAYFTETDNRFNLGVGKPPVRFRVYEQMKQCGGRFHTLVSPKAHLSADVRLEDGVSILAHAVLENGGFVGSGTLINLAALVCHDVRIGRFSEISPGAILLGESVIGDQTFVGAGAIVNPGVRVGSGVTIGSGTVVLHDVPDGTTLVGVPGRIIKGPL